MGNKFTCGAKSQATLVLILFRNSPRNVRVFPMVVGAGSPKDQTDHGIVSAIFSPLNVAHVPSPRIMLCHLMRLKCCSGQI